MSVTVILSWGVVKYGIRPPAQVGISFCNNEGTCMTGSGNLTRDTNGLKVTGTVDITSVPHSVDVIKVIYAGSKIFEVTGVGQIIDYTGSISVIISEQWVVSLPVTFTIEGPSTLVWRVSNGPIAFMHIVRGVDISDVDVEYYDADGRLVYTDRDARVTLIAPDVTASMIQEKLETSAYSTDSVKICRLVAKAGANTIFEASATEQVYCFDIVPSVSITITAAVAAQG